MVRDLGRAHLRKLSSLFAKAVWKGTGGKGTRKKKTEGMKDRDKSRTLTAS